MAQPALPIGIAPRNFYPGENRDPQPAKDLKARIDQLAKTVVTIGNSEREVSEAVSKRKVEVGKLSYCKEQILSITHQITDLKRQLEEVGLDIPFVKLLDRAQIPGLMNDLLPLMLQLEIVNLRSKRLCYLLQSEDFQDALYLYRQVSSSCQDTLMSSESLQEKVSCFENQAKELEQTYSQQSKSLASVEIRHSFTVKCIHKETLQLFVQALSELKQAINGLKVDESRRELLDPQIDSLIRKNRDLLAELAGDLTHLAEEVKEWPDLGKLPEDFSLDNFCKGISSREQFLFNPKISLFALNGQHRRTIDLAKREFGNAATVLSFFCDIIEGKKGQKGLTTLLAQEAFQNEQHLVQKFLRECEVYKNVIGAIQKQLFEIVVGTNGASNLYQLSFNPHTTPLLDHAAHLLESIEDVRQVLLLLADYSTPEKARVFQAKTVVCDYLQADRASLKELYSLFSAFQATDPLRERFPRTKAVELSSFFAQHMDLTARMSQLRLADEAAGDIALKSSFSSRFMGNALGMLTDTIAAQAPVVVTYTEDEEALFDHISAKKSGVPAAVKRFLAKSIIGQLYLPSQKSCDMRVALVVHNLKNHPPYFEAYNKEILQDPALQSMLETYYQATEKHALSFEQLNKACAVFEVIYKLLDPKNVNILATSQAWQACMELEGMARNDAQHKEPFRELKLLALNKLGAKFKNFFFPEMGREISLQLLLAWPGDFMQDDRVDKRALFMQALAAAIWAEDIAERNLGQQVVHRFLQWQGFNAWMDKMAEQKVVFYPLIYENILRKGQRKDFGQFIPEEWQLLREALHHKT